MCIYLVVGASVRRATQANIARAFTNPAGLTLVKMAVFVAKSTDTTTNVLVLKVRKPNIILHIIFRDTHLSWSYPAYFGACEYARAALGVLGQLVLQHRVYWHMQSRCLLPIRKVLW